MRPHSSTASLAKWLLKASASRAEDPGFEYRFPGSSLTSDLKIGTPVAALPGAWRRRVSAGTGWPRCQYIVTGRDDKFDQQLLSQCGRR